MEDKSPQPLLKSLTDDLQSLQERINSLLSLLQGPGIIPTSGTGQPLSIESLNKLFVELSKQESQQEILSVLLTSASALAGRSILFRVDESDLLALHGAGFTAEQLEALRVARSGPFGLALDGLKEVALKEHPARVLPWLKKLGQEPVYSLIVPLVFGSEVPLVLYVDSAEEISPAPIQFLVRLTVLHLQNHYLAYLTQKRAAEDVLGPRSETAAGDATPGGDTEKPSEAMLDSEMDVALVEGDEGLLELSEEEEEAAHGEARRLARLLVAEIKLYNEEEVEEGRRHGDLYRRLRTDIERSRKMYEKRVHPAIQTQADYFASELVKVLAMDDPSLMGEEHSGAEVLNPISPEKS